MTPEVIAEVRPRLVAFAAEMLGGLRARISGRPVSCICARAAHRWPTEVDAADGGAAGSGPPVAAAVHHVFDLGFCGSRPASRWRPCSSSSSAPAPVLPARHARPPRRRPHRNLTKSYLAALGGCASAACERVFVDAGPPRAGVIARNSARAAQTYVPSVPGAVGGTSAPLRAEPGAHATDPLPAPRGMANPGVPGRLPGL